MEELDENINQLERKLQVREIKDETNVVNVRKKSKISKKTKRKNDESEDEDDEINIEYTNKQDHLQGIKEELENKELSMSQRKCILKQLHKMLDKDGYELLRSERLSNTVIRLQTLYTRAEFLHEIKKFNKCNRIQQRKLENIIYSTRNNMILLNILVIVAVFLIKLLIV